MLGILWYLLLAWLARLLGLVEWELPAGGVGGLPASSCSTTATDCCAPASGGADSSEPPARTNATTTAATKIANATTTYAQVGPTSQPSRCGLASG